MSEKPPMQAEKKVERCPQCRGPKWPPRTIGAPPEFGGKGYRRCPNAFHVAPAPPDAEGEQRCEKCSSPIDPVSGRSLYEFDVSVPMGELRESLAAAEARTEALQAALERINSFEHDPSEKGWYVVSQLQEIARTALANSREKPF